MRSMGRGRSMLSQRRPPALSVSTFGVSGCSGGPTTTPRAPRRRRGRFGMRSSRLVGQHRGHQWTIIQSISRRTALYPAAIGMARKPPLLVALLTLLALGAAPAAADAATFSIASVAPAEVTEGMTASVVVTRNAPADHATHVQVDGLPGERGVFFAPRA